MFGIRNRLTRKRRKVTSKSWKGGDVNSTLYGIDEVGSIKGPGGNRSYAIVSARITDRFAFEELVKDMAERYGVTSEISFNTHRPLRILMLKEMAPLVEDVRYVCVYRPPGYEFKQKPKAVHEMLLKELSKDLGLKRGEDVLIMVDHNTIIPDSHVKGLFIPDGQTKNMDCVVLPSRFFYELQGHDMIAGAIGAELNSFDSRYVSILEEYGVVPKGRYIRLKLRDED